MAVQLEKKLLSVADYLLMAKVGILTEEDKVELIHGEIVHMSPSGSKHAGKIIRLSRILSELLGKEFLLSIQNPFTISPFSAPEPDLAILRFRPDHYETAHPEAADVLLVIEVAESSLAYDREIKVPLYAASGIPHYVIVDIENAQLEYYHKPQGKQYQDMEILGMQRNLSIEEIKLNLPIASIFS